MKEAPIFIVGVPRSGTTLLAAMLSAHSRMSCGPETHFFRWLSNVDPNQICRLETWPDPAVDFICSVKHSFSDHNGKVQSRSLTDKYQIEKRQVANYLKNRQPSISRILASVTEQYMTRMGKHRWVEKTPDHIEYVQLIRTHFPNSPIIRIIRDPRDVALSLDRVPWGARSFFDALLGWKRLDQTSRQFFSTDNICHTLRFEDLVSSPRKTLQTLCYFIGEEFEESMLDTSSAGKQVNSMAVPWKSRAGQPPDTSRISVWRSKLSRQQNQLAESLLGDRLEAYGYAREEDFALLADFYPASNLAWKYPDAFEVLAVSGVRIWKEHKNEKPTVRVYLGDPGNYNWLGEKWAARLVNTLLISVDVGKTVFSHNHLFWIPDPYSSNWTGYRAYLLKKLLSPHKIVPLRLR